MVRFLKCFPQESSVFLHKFIFIYFVEQYSIDTKQCARLTKPQSSPPLPPPTTQIQTYTRSNIMVENKTATIFVQFVSIIQRGEEIDLIQ